MQPGHQKSRPATTSPRPQSTIPRRERHRPPQRQPRGRARPAPRRGPNRVGWARGTAASPQTGLPGEHARAGRAHTVRPSSRPDPSVPFHPASRPPRAESQDRAKGEINGWKPTDTVEKESVGNGPQDREAHYYGAPFPAGQYRHRILTSTCGLLGPYCRSYPKATLRHMSARTLDPWPLICRS